MSNSIVMGADIGGSHITAALVDLHTKRVLQETWTRRKVNSHGDVNEIVQSWANAIKEPFNKFDLTITKVGIGIPGPFDYEKGVCFVNDQDKYQALYGLNVKDLLSIELGIASKNIRLMNDAACFLKGEAFSGAGKEYSKLIGITLGTGIGSSIYSYGEARDADRWKNAFKDSIAEHYLSSRWFLNRYRQLTGKSVQDVVSLVSLAEREALVSQIFEEFGYNGFL